MWQWFRGYERKKTWGEGGGVLPSVLNRGYTISHFRPRVPANLLLFSPFSLISCAFFEMCEKGTLCASSVFNTAWLVQSWTGQEITALSLRRGSKIYIFYVLNRVRVSLGRPNRSYANSCWVGKELNVHHDDPAVPSKPGSVMLWCTIRHAVQKTIRT